MNMQMRKGKGDEEGFELKDKDEEEQGISSIILLLC